MLLPQFEYHEPSTLKEACALLAELGDSASPLAGGTDLLVKMKRKILAPRHVVSLGHLNEIRNVEMLHGGFKIGALVTAGRITESDELRKTLPGLYEGALSLGSPLVRNLATLGGNIVSARPAADLPPPLMAYGGNVLVTNGQRERIIPLKDFFKGPGETGMEPGEILARVHVDLPPPYSGAAYMKLGTRKALEISLVNVASFIALEGPDGVIRSARIAMGAVGPKPLRAFSAEALLKGERPSKRVFEAAGEAAAGDSMPIDDFRGSAEYRRAMVKVLTVRTLSSALARAKNKKS